MNREAGGIPAALADPENIPDESDYPHPIIASQWIWTVTKILRRTDRRPRTGDLELGTHFAMHHPLRGAEMIRPPISNFVISNRQHPRACRHVAPDAFASNPSRARSALAATTVRAPKSLVERAKHTRF